MRITEACSLRKRDFDTSGIRIKINIPAKFTKNKQARTTYLSKEAGNYVKPILDRINDDKLVFGTSEDPNCSKMNEIIRFTRVREKAGFIEKYASGTHKISLHSFRAWFISKCNRVDFGIGHAFAGHDLYMKQYDRHSEQDKLEFYLKAEQSLMIYDVPVNENEMDDIRKKNEVLEEEVERQRIVLERVVKQLENKS